MISVVIPAFNAGRFIRRTIDSILAQTYSDYEIIVVDDGSTDSTGEVVKNYGEKVRYIYQENAGDGPARNTGIAAAEGEWIAFLDHDDEWLPQKLRLQAKLLDRNPDLRWCGTNFYRQSGTRRTIAGRPDVLNNALGDKEYFENFFAAVGRKGCSLVTATMVVHKDVFEQVGVFDSSWLLCADLDMWWRIAYRFPRVGYLPQPLAIMHLDVLDRAATKRHLAGKRGEDARKLVGRHLKLARESGCLEEFRPLARKILRKSLVTTIYHGFKEDARTTVRDFPGLFPWYWCVATYLLTVFPKLTAVLARAVANLAYKLRLEREVTRRWIHSRKVKKMD